MGFNNDLSLYIAKLTAYAGQPTASHPVGAHAAVTSFPHHK